MLKIKLHSKLIQGEYSRFQDFDELDESLKDVEQTRKAFPDKAALIDRFVASPISDNKYIYWMIRHSEEAPPEEMLSMVDKYDRLVKKEALADPDLANITRLKSFEQLKDVVETNVENRKVILLSKESGGGRFEIIRPMNVQTTCHLFSDISRWCIAATLSQNYFKRYSRGGAVFYTIIDHSKSPKKDPSHMFTYTFVTTLPKSYGLRNVSSMVQGTDYEIYNAADTLVSREDVADSIGSDNEARFFSMMRKDSGASASSAPSELLEDWRHFLVRIKPKIALIKPDAETAQINISGALQEIEEFYDEWVDEYKGNTTIAGDKEKALQNILLFTKNIAKVSNFKFKKALANDLEKSYVKAVPELEKFLEVLRRNPNWREDSEKQFAILSKEETYKTSREEYIEEVLKDFVDNATVYKLDDKLKKLFDLYLEFYKKDQKASKSDSDWGGITAENWEGQFKRNLIYLFIKALVNVNNPHTVDYSTTFFDSIHGNDPYKIQDAFSLTINVANNLKDSKRSAYKNIIAKHTLDKMKEIGDKKDYARICSDILGHMGISPEISDIAIEHADDVSYAYSESSAKKYSTKSLKRLIDELIKERREKFLTTFAFSNRIRYIAAGENLTEGLAKTLLMMMALYNKEELYYDLRPQTVESIRDNMKRLGIDMDDYIKKSKDEIKKAGAAGLLGMKNESKVFLFNKDYKVFKTV